MDRNAELVLEVFRALENRDPERFLALHHENVEYDWPRALAYGGTLQGIATLQRRLETEPEKTWLGTWGPLQPTEQERRMDPRVVSSNGREVVVLYRQRALSPDGERFDEPVLGLYEVRDGKFAQAQMFHFDTAGILEFLGRARGSSAELAT